MSYIVSWVMIILQKGGVYYALIPNFKIKAYYINLDKIVPYHSLVEVLLWISTTIN